jgi:hypothetical protein
VFFYATVHFNVHGMADMHGFMPLVSPDTGQNDCYRIAVGDIDGAIGP